MQTDALNRRLRHAKPQPLRATIEISERDLLVFEKLNRHGPLPSSYLYELTKRLGSHWPTFQRRLHAYMQLLRQNAQKTHWGLPTLMVLTVTTNSTHLANMLDYLRRMNEPKLAERFLFKAKHEFGPNWRVPGIMRDLLVEPWMRANGEPFYIDRAGR